MLALLQLLLPERATKKRVAVLIYPVGEVLTGHADASAFPALKPSVVDQAPLLHRSTASTDALAVGCRGVQGRCARPTPTSLAG